MKGNEEADEEAKKVARGMGSPTDKLPKTLQLEGGLKRSAAALKRKYGEHAELLGYTDWGYYEADGKEVSQEEFEAWLDGLLGEKVVWHKVSE